MERDITLSQNLGTFRTLLDSKSRAPAPAGAERGRTHSAHVIYTLSLAVEVLVHAEIAFFPYCGIRRSYNLLALQLTTPFLPEGLQQLFQLQLSARVHHYLIIPRPSIGHSVSESLVVRICNTFSPPISVQI